MEQNSYEQGVIEALNYTSKSLLPGCVKKFHGEKDET